MSGTTTEGTETDADHLKGTGAATEVTSTGTPHPATVTGVKHAADATQGVRNETAGLGVLLDVTGIETGIKNVESEMVRHLSFFRVPS